MRWIVATVAPLLAAGLLVSIGSPSRSDELVQVDQRAAEVGCVAARSVEPVPAPTGPSWFAIRLGFDHAAGLSQGVGQLIAVLDTGVVEVPAIVGAVRPAIDLLQVPVTDAAMPTADNTTDEADCDGRGTAMAGLIAASRGPGAELPGLARAAQILPIRVTATANDPPEPGVLAMGLDAAVAAGATVALVGSAVRDDPALLGATVAALDAGVAVVAAAGDGDDQALAFPAGYDGVISVAATGRQDDPRAVNAVGRVTVAAPGADLLGFGLTGDFVTGLGGSAYAAALVAATVADLRATHPELTPANLRQRLIATADRPGVAVPDPAVGWGVINPVTALTAPTTDAGPTPASAAVASPAVVVDLPPEAVDNSWSITIAGLLLTLAGGIAAVVSGVRLAARRRWRPATDRPPAEPAATDPVH
ncbi:MAG: S8 family serine peptidase [Nakamurella sp.]